MNLLAAQWGDLFTSVTDLPWGSTTDPSGRRLVVVGTENRQNVLGHLALLGARRPTLPLASGGPPEGRMAGALDILLADWADRCHAAGGLVIGAHFPLPYAEIAADIVSGKIDALEAQALSPGLDDPAIVEWYRFLNLGDRLPIVAGTDKMSAEVPVGAVRTYTHLLADDALSFDAWAAAVRAGRTFISSGPVVELAVDGREPGDTVELRAPGRLEVVAVARAAQPVITDLELVVNGRIVAAVSAAAGSTELAVHETIPIDAGSWIAARSRSAAEIQSAFTTSMAAHTSPVYVEVAGRPLVPAADDARRGRAGDPRGPDLGRPSWRRSPSRPSGRGWSPSSTRASRRSAPGWQRGRADRARRPAWRSVSRGRGCSRGRRARARAAATPSGGDAVLDRPDERRGGEPAHLAGRRGDRRQARVGDRRRTGSRRSRRWPTSSGTRMPSRRAARPSAHSASLSS